MAERKIFMTEFDKSRLEELIAMVDEFEGHGQLDLESLAEELDQTEVVLPKEDFQTCSIAQYSGLFSKYYAF